MGKKAKSCRENAREYFLTGGTFVSYTFLQLCHLWLPTKEMSLKELILQEEFQYTVETGNIL